MIARRYGGRPSEYVGITDEWVAFEFDAAILLRAALQKGDEDGGSVGAHVPASSYTTSEGRMVWNIDELYQKGWRGGTVTPKGWKPMEGQE